MDTSNIFGFNIFEEPDDKESIRERREAGEEPEDFPLLGKKRSKVGKRPISDKRRRGLILSALRRNVVRTPKLHTDITKLVRIRRSSKDRAKPIPKFYFETYKVLRRRKV